MKNWRDLAACKDEDSESWFPESGETPTTAKKICRACPVAADCLDHALTHRIPDGVWGGMSPNERQRIRRRAS